MSQINYNQIQLIVEKSMRDAGLKGDFENGWKSQLVDAAGNTIQNAYNLQNMRDATAQAILDALTGVNVVGTLSTGVVQGVQVKAGTNSQINISKQNAALPLVASPAARVGDSVSIDDSIFLAWVINVTAAINALAFGSVPIVPTSIVGKITTGSSEVSIGDSNVQIGS